MRLPDFHFPRAYTSGMGNVQRYPLSILIVLLLLFVPETLSAQVLLGYSHSAGEKWHITSEVDEEVLVDGELVYEAEILNKISVETLEGNGADGLLRNIYSIAESRKNSDVYVWSGEYEASYRRDTSGRLSDIPEGSAIPTVRNVPVYPEYELFPGDRWTADGVEVFDLTLRYGIPMVLEIEFMADYTYEGQVERDGKLLELITIAYSFVWQPDFETLILLRRNDAYPLSVVGEFQQTVHFDTVRGRNFDSDGMFSYTYVMSDGYVDTFRGRSTGQAVYVEPLDRDTLIQEIEDLEQEDLRVEAVNEGVKVSLDNLNFVPDEAVLLSGQETKLAGILDILSRYSNRDVQIIGHTARVKGAGDGQELSEERAETVARLVIDSETRSRDQITIRGLGNRDPIGDNAVESGRRLNRRVEIIILEN